MRHETRVYYDEEFGWQWICETHGCYASSEIEHPNQASAQAEAKNHETDPENEDNDNLADLDYDDEDDVFDLDDGHGHCAGCGLPLDRDGWCHQCS